MFLALGTLFLVTVAAAHAGLRQDAREAARLAAADKAEDARGAAVVDAAVVAADVEDLVVAYRATLWSLGRALAHMHVLFSILGRYDAACGRRARWLSLGYMNVLFGAGKGCESPTFKGSYLGRFPLVSADFWTGDHRNSFEA